MRSRFGAALCLVALAAPAAAQEIRGTARETGTGRPVTGAVIALLDSAGNTLGRNITTEAGGYRIVAPDKTARLRFIRIGYRPRTVVVPRARGAIATIDVTMDPLPTLLEPVAVRADACPRRADEASALGLLEQARASLLNAVVARDGQSGILTRLVYEREMKDVSDEIVHQRVRVDSASSLSRSAFGAARHATDFVRDGFLDETSTGAVFFGPDADVLLDDAFVAAYCFRLERPARDRPNDVGLGFSPAHAQRGHIDIVGSLWVDTASRQIRRLDFRYTGLDASVARANPGGRIEFRQMPNGVVLIDRWALRLPAVRQDSTFSPRTGKFERRSWVEAQESGGEVARIVWADGTSWDAPLGRLEIATARHDAQAPASTELWLDDTDYRARADATGRVVFDRLLPGPYEPVVLDSLLTPLGITLKTPLRFSAVRDSIHRATLDVPTAEEYVEQRCRHDGIWKEVHRSRSDVAWMLGRIVDARDRPVADVKATVSAGGRAAVARANMSPIEIETRPTGTDGIFQLCSNAFRVGDTVRVRVSQRARPFVDFLFRLPDTLSVLPLIRVRPGEPR